MRPNRRLQGRHITILLSRGFREGMRLSRIIGYWLFGLLAVFVLLAQHDARADDWTECGASVGAPEKIIASCTSVIDKGARSKKSLPPRMGGAACNSIAQVRRIARSRISTVLWNSVADPTPRFVASTIPTGGSGPKRWRNTTKGLSKIQKMPEFIPPAGARWWAWDGLSTELQATIGRSRSTRCPRMDSINAARHTARRATLTVR